MLRAAVLLGWCCCFCTALRMAPSASLQASLHARSGPPARMLAKKKGGGGIAQLVKLWNDRQTGAHTKAQEAILRDRVTQSWIENELLRVTAQRARAAQKAGNPGPEGSVSKLAQAELNKAIWECAMDVLGAAAGRYQRTMELLNREIT